MGSVGAGGCGRVRGRVGDDDSVTVRPQAQMLLFSFFLVFLCVGFLSLLPSQGVLYFFYRGFVVFF